MRLENQWTFIKDQPINQMMTDFNQIELFLDGTYTKEERVDFVFRSRKVCNYLERKLIDLKFKTDLNRVNFKISRDESVREVRRLKGAPFLEAKFFHNLPLVTEIPDYQLDQHLSEILRAGLPVAKEEMEIPIEFCNQVLAEFEEKDFLNTWIHSDKKWENESCRSVVEAELSMRSFTVTQRIYRDGRVVVSQRIGESKPRDMLFMPLLGKVKLEKDGHIVYENKGKIISKFSLEKNSFCKFVKR